MSVLATSDAIQTIINRTWTTQRLCRHYDVTPMTVHVWRSKGLPCILIKGDKRPSVRFLPCEVIPWVKDFKKGKAK